MNLEAYYAPEVERALVSLLWHQPQQLPHVLQKLSPQDFSDWLCRLVIEAIALAYSEQGQVDFTMVVEILRELDQLENCGGLVSLESLYTVWDRLMDERHYEPLIDFYVGLLKVYAAQREPDAVPLTGFTGGSGKIVRQDQGKANFRGNVRICGKTYSVLGYLEAEPLSPYTINLRFYPYHGTRRFQKRRGRRLAKKGQHASASGRGRPHKVLALAH